MRPKKYTDILLAYIFHISNRTPLQFSDSDNGSMPSVDKILKQRQTVMINESEL